MTLGTSTSTNETTSLLIEGGGGTWDPTSNVNVNGLLYGGDEPNATNTNTHRSEDNVEDECDVSETSSQEGLRLMGAGSNNGDNGTAMTTTTTTNEGEKILPIWNIICILSSSFAYGCIMTTLFVITLPIECERIERENLGIPKSVRTTMYSAM